MSAGEIRLDVGFEMADELRVVIDRQVEGGIACAVVRAAAAMKYHEREDRDRGDRDRYSSPQAGTPNRETSGAGAGLLRPPRAALAASDESIASSAARIEPRTIGGVRRIAARSRRQRLDRALLREARATVDASREMLFDLAQLRRAQLTVNVSRQVLLNVGVTIHSYSCTGSLTPTGISVPESRPYYSTLFGKVG